MEEQFSEEDLKSMSPEEIRELQKKQCIFCHIISGRVASRKVYEDDHCTAILDINPANPGHVLLLPKEHYPIMPQMEDEVTGHIFTVAKHISHALLIALKADGTYIFVANGVAAGQKAAHFMVHIIPRKEGDDLALDIPEGFIKREQLEQLKDVLTRRMTGSAEEPEKLEPAVTKPEPGIDLDSISALVAKKGVEEIKKRSERYISSSSSEKFHMVNCPFAKRISQKNRVYFKTREDARAAKKIPCECVSD